MLTKEALSQYKRWVNKEKNSLISEESLQILHETFKELNEFEKYDVYYNDFYKFLDKNIENGV